MITISDLNKKEETKIFFDFINILSLQFNLKIKEKLKLQTDNEKTILLLDIEENNKLNIIELRKKVIEYFDLFDAKIVQSKNKLLLKLLF